MNLMAFSFPYLIVEAEQRKSTLQSNIAIDLIYLLSRKDHAHQHACRRKKEENHRASRTRDSSLCVTGGYRLCESAANALIETDSTEKD
jgi:hypothetical protein